MVKSPEFGDACEQSIGCLPLSSLYLIIQEETNKTMEITTLRVDWISDLDTDHFANFAFPFLFISSKIIVHLRRYIKHDHPVFHPTDI